MELSDSEDDSACLAACAASSALKTVVTVVTVVTIVLLVLGSLVVVVLLRVLVPQGILVRAMADQGAIFGHVIWGRRRDLGKFASVGFLAEGTRKTTYFYGRL